MTRRAVRSGAGAARPGMTLVEVIVAMLILTGVLFTLGGFSAKFAQANGQAHLVISANEIAAARLDLIRTQATYQAIDTLRTLGAPDQVRVDNTVFQRTTAVLRVGSEQPADSVDYRVMTVTVRHPSMRKVVSKTTAIAAF